MSPGLERLVTPGRRERLPVQIRIARLRQAIASERVTTKVAVWSLEPRLARIEQLLLRLRRVPAYAARLAPYAVPIVGLVFRRSRIVRFALRSWGVVRLARSIARAVVARRRAAARNHGSALQGEFE